MNVIANHVLLQNEHQFAISRSFNLMRCVLLLGEFSRNLFKVWLFIGKSMPQVVNKERANYVIIRTKYVASVALLYT